MELILQEIDKAINAGFYYLSLAIALTLPDICAALGAQNGQTSKALFLNWYNQNLALKYPNITAEDFYSLRCGVIHQGRMGHPKMQYSRVLFTVPNANRNVFHNNIIDDALNLDICIFCKDVTGSVNEWFKQNQHDENIARNLDLMVQPRPLGLAPYMVGMPLIA